MNRMSEIRESTFEIRSDVTIHGETIRDLPNHDVTVHDLTIHDLTIHDLTIQQVTPQPC